MTTSQSALLSPTAPWRSDPIRAAEAIAGALWFQSHGVAELETTQHNLLADVWASERRRDECARDENGWDVVDGPGGRECGTAGIRAASLALVEAVIRGAVTLPAECPGLKVLEVVP